MCKAFGIKEEWGGRGKRQGRIGRGETEGRKMWRVKGSKTVRRGEREARG